MGSDILELDDLSQPEAPPVNSGKRRRWNSENYPKAIVCRVTDEEHTEINRRAGLSAAPSTSRYMVACALRGRAPELRATPPPTDEQREQFERLLYELRKAGTNLNQLAHAANLAQMTGGQVPPAGQIVHAAQTVAMLVEQIRERL